MRDVTVGDRTLRVHEDGPADGLPVFWHHGTPGTGVTPPIFTGPRIRLISHDRPGYGASTRNEGRDVAAVAADVTAIADALGIGRFATVGASGGGPHALALAALLPDRVLGVVSFAGIAPHDAEGLDWFAGMHPSGAAELRAAADGPDALREHLTTAEFVPEVFIPADFDAMSGPMGWLAADAGGALPTGIDGMVDDDLAFVRPWGFDVADVAAPVLILQGEQDRMVPAGHGKWLAAHCPNATMHLFPADGHVSVLTHNVVALDWLGELGAH